MESLFGFLFKYRPVIFGAGDVSFAPPAPIWILAAAAGIALGLVGWSYARAPRVPRRDRIALALLRTAALAILFFCLLRPQLRVPTVVPQRNTVGILVDDSRSMRIIDGDQPRAAAVAQLLGEEAALQRALAEKFQLRTYRFSSDVERVPDLTQLRYNGQATRLAPALDRAREDLSSVPLSGLVVISDGADNAGTELTESLLALRAAGVPVYTVGVGRERFDRDVELARVASPRAVLKGSSVVVDLMVSQTGYAGRNVTLFVEDEGRVVGMQEVTLPADGEPTAVRVQFSADEPGARRFSFRVPVQDGELVLENNEQEALIEVRDGREKILYFEGEPRPEVAFLRRAIADDENIQLVVLLRSAENKYLRLAVDSAGELATGFPTTREELFTYRGLILGSVEASQFTHEQLRMIADFVGERGGGLLMIGGRRAFAEGGWAGTPVADVLPVTLQPTTDTMFFAQARIIPTRAGESHAITRIAADEVSSRARWDSLPPLSTTNRIAGLKPGATALLTARGDDLDRDQPVLAFHRYGRGQAMAFAVQDVWHWQMHADIPLEDQTHENLWRQLLRFLVSSVPGQLEAETSADRVAPGDPVRISARVGDAAFAGVNDGYVVARVLGPAGEEVEAPLDWTVERDGEYTGTFTPSDAGVYSIVVEATRGGELLAADTTHIAAAESAAEYFAAQMRAPLLRRVAEETGGRFYTTDEAQRLAEDLAVTGGGATITETRDLWDMPALLFALIGIIAAEWFWRRSRGLA